MIRSVSRAVCATSILLVLAGAAAGESAGSSSRANSRSDSIALFEGRLVDLSKGWGAARACLVDESVGVVECFRTRTMLLLRERQLANTTEAGAPNPAEVEPYPGGIVGRPGLPPSYYIPSFSKIPGRLSCSSPLRLYANAGYGGRELDFYDRALWQNLGDWGFDNQVSSYKVGACSVDLAEGVDGTTPFDPGNTSAGHGEQSMQSGWDNRVSSVYLA